MNGTDMGGTDKGGEGADIDVATSVSSMRRVVAGLTPKGNGGFVNVDETISW